jgi:RHS repeat-associated protein
MNRIYENSKEFDNISTLNWNDYSARHYDATLGRFTTPDPLAEKYYSISPYAYCAGNPMRFIDPDGKAAVDAFGGPVETYLINLWDYYKEIYKSVTVTVSVGLQVGAKAEVAGKSVGAAVNFVSGELELLNDGKLSVNNTSVTQGAELSIGLAGVGIENEVKDNGNGTATKTETVKGSVLMLESGVQTITEHKENKNGTYTQSSKTTELAKPTVTVGAQAQALVGVEAKVDIGRVWQALKDFFKNTFVP